jgi:hypothetical protein
MSAWRLKRGASRQLDCPAGAESRTLNNYQPEASFAMWLTYPAPIFPIKLQSSKEDMSALRHVVMSAIIAIVGWEYVGKN